MDPRLNSGLTSQPQKPPQPMPAAAVPAPHPAPVAPAEHAPANSVSQPITPQLVASFPVKLPEETPAHTSPSVPASPAPQAATDSPKDDDLDKILQAVNNRVKSPDKAAESKKKVLGKKILSKTSAVAAKAKSPKPIGPLLAVLIVFTMLSTTAILAYREGNRTAIAAKQAGKVGTSYTASSAIQDAGGALVHPADLDDYAQTLQTKLNSLNNNQDFASSSLSDQTLGL